MKSFLKYLLICTACCFLISIPLHACTIFTLVSPKRVLFCNNEDWTDSNTRIWFAPAAPDSSIDKKKYGCAYVGFTNQWGQGGVNTEGLAYDWVAGFSNTWKQNAKLKKVNGNPAERMLESSSTVEEAILFFQTYWEPGFSSAKILVADRSGTSAIVTAKDRKLDIKISEKSHGLGYGIEIIQKSLYEISEPTLMNASSLLRDSIQQGQYATRYSNVFNLKTGDIYIFRFPYHSNSVKLNLIEELKKGPHYYDIPLIEEQLGQNLRSTSRFKEWLKTFY